MFPNTKPSLDIIIGPMFSGKTTELLRRLTIFAELGLSVLYVNTNKDDRSQTDFSTHNKLISNDLGNILSTKVENLVDVDISGFDVVGVDEAQMFSDLTEFYTRVVEVKCKKLIIAGLNGDFMLRPFGKIIDLIPHCDNITKLYPFCTSCMKENKTITPALFSKRTTADTETIVVGAKDMYIPVCRECYKK